MTDTQIIESTQHWLDTAVIGLNLCPFAKAVRQHQRIRFCVSTATDDASLVQDLASELQLLHECDPLKIETALLIHPHAMLDFLDFNDFLDVADQVVESLDLSGELQVASFHPQFQFADTDVNDITNFTNRSPYPTLHLLRESSVEWAVQNHPDTDAIYQHNIEVLRRLGHDGWEQLGIRYG